MGRKYEYEPHEKIITWNDDPDLKPITWELPDPPPLETIDGYGLHPSKQKFQHRTLPHKLRKLNGAVTTEDGKQELTPRQKCELLEREPDYYHEEIQFIKEEWERRENGYWFFNNGVPTYITGDHYFYLQWWTIDGLSPEYRMRDRRWFLFWDMVEKDDYCFGFNNPKQRREGATTKTNSTRWNRTARTPFYKTGMQNKDEKTAEETHEQGIYVPAKRIPFFFQPISDQKQNVITVIRFFTPTTSSHPDRNEVSLESYLDFKDSGVKAYDGLKRNFIHNDECGKTESIDIRERVRIQIPCLTNIVRNSPIKGKMINTSTTGEMEKGGGKYFKSLCDASDYHKRNKEGMTTSGLYVLFQSAKEGMEGIDMKSGKSYVDEFGNPRPELIEESLNNKREAHREAGDIPAYIEECRQYPLRYSDCWKTSARRCNFNLLILEERLNDFRNEDEIQTTRGNFRWAKGEDSHVIFEPHPDGRFEVSYLFTDPKHANRMTIDDNNMRFPANTHKFVAGADPYKFDKTKKVTNSDGGGAVFYKFDISEDRDRVTSQWESNRFVCTYRYRPPTREEYGEDMLMMCVYYGCEVNAERNAWDMSQYFYQRGYGGYLYYRYDPKKRKFDDEAGTNALMKVNQDIFFRTQTYIDKHGMRERHVRLLQEWKDLEDDLGDYDLAAAAGHALCAAGDTDNYQEEDEEITDISDYFALVSYKEN